MSIPFTRRYGWKNNSQITSRATCLACLYERVALLKNPPRTNSVYTPQEFVLANPVIDNAEYDIYSN